MMILFLRVETRIFVVAISLFLAGRIKLVSGDCNDPGTPAHGSRSVASAGTKFGTGTVVKFLCNANYERVGSKKIFCSSNGIWLGKIPVCNPKGCPLPPPSFAHAHIVTYPVSNTKGSYISYSCDSGFFTSHSVTRILCDKDRKSQDLVWNGVVSCQRIKCPLPLAPENGHVTYTSLYYNSSWRYTGKARYSCHQGYILTYRMYGETLYHSVLMRNCTRSGRWSSVVPRCVLKKCESPGLIQYGRFTANNSIFTIWTTVTFQCFSGYELSGVKSRQCLPSGVWTGRSNPVCRKGTSACREPDAIAHGTHISQGSFPYRLGDKVQYKCNSDYVLWGYSKFVCKTVGDRSDWVPSDPDADCLSSTMCQMTPECLPLAEFEENCKKKSGYHLKFPGGEPTCLPATTVIPSTSPRVGELDKMTIVVATAGSTLGALVVLLTALVCVRRFHRSRRFSHSALRRHRYSDDERIAIIAAYTGDVHFILPSYDEAMSQVERSPPSFDSVVQNNQPSANNNDPALTDTANANTGANSVVRQVRITEISSATNVHVDSANENRERAEDQSINLVSNPLAYSTIPSVVVENSAQGDGDNVASAECAVTDDSLPLRRSESLQSSSSDDEVATSQTQPLLGSA